jgi:hypothetical protein
VGYDIFAMVVNFIYNAWHPNQITIALFEVQNASCVYMAKQVKGLLEVFWFIAYMKVKGSNFTSLSIDLTLIMSCSYFKLVSPFVRSSPFPCFYY